MQSLVICSAAEDSEMARDIRCYLEANCPFLYLHDDVVTPSANELLETVEGALSSDICLLLLSPDSIPGAWSRQQWEPVLVDQPRELGTTLVFVLARPCAFPQIFRKSRFFDLSADLRTGRRKLRQWLVEQNPVKLERIELLPPRPSAPAIDVSGMEDQVLDQPGICFDVARESALSFAHAHSREFEAVFWLDCLERDQRGVIGDTAHALGLKLLGPVPQNALALQEFCARQRCLFVFDALAVEHRDVVAFQGRASVIFTKESVQPASTLTLDETVEIFAAWRSKPEECLRHLRDADRYLRSLSSNCSPETSVATKSLATCTFLLLREQERLAEAYEVLQLLSKLAWEEGSATDLRRWEWEKSWIRESWGESPAARLRLGTAPEPQQMDLGF